MKIDHGSLVRVFGAAGIIYKRRVFWFAMLLIHVPMIPYTAQREHWIDFFFSAVVSVCVTLLLLISYRVVRKYGVIVYLSTGFVMGAPKSPCVYVIQDMDVTGYCKIGRTTDLSSRLKTFAVKMPFRIGLLVVIPCRDAVAMESKLHQQYKAKRVRGEWFNLSFVDVCDLYDIAMNQVNQISDD